MCWNYFYVKHQTLHHVDLLWNNELKQISISKPLWYSLNTAQHEISPSLNVTTLCSLYAIYYSFVYLCCRNIAQYYFRIAKESQLSSRYHYLDQKDHQNVNFDNFAGSLGQLKIFWLQWEFFSNSYIMLYNIVASQIHKGIICGIQGAQDSNI